MSRARLAAAALYAYPEATRQALGAEMLATVAEASVGARRRYLREVGDLVRGGMRARALETARTGAGRVLEDGVCLAGAWVMTFELTVAVAQRWRGMQDPLLASPSIALLVVVLALALVGLDRAAGAGAIAWLVLRLPALVADQPGKLGLAGQVIPLACFAVMIVAPRQGPVQPRRLAYLLVPAGLAVVAGSQTGGLPVLIILAAAIGVVAYATLMLPADPRLAIAGAIPTTALGVGVLDHGIALPALLLTAAAPAVIAVTIAVARGRLRSAS